MSIQSEVDRIGTAKNAIRNAIEAKGVSVPSDASIDDYAEKISEIETGGKVEVNKTKIDITAYYNETGTGIDWYGSDDPSDITSNASSVLQNFGLYYCTLSIDGVVIRHYIEGQYRNLSVGIAENALETTSSLFIAKLSKNVLYSPYDACTGVCAASRYTTNLGGPTGTYVLYRHATGVELLRVLFTFNAKSPTGVPLYYVNFYA